MTIIYRKIGLKNNIFLQFLNFISLENCQCNNIFFSCIPAADDFCLTGALIHVYIVVLAVDGFWSRWGSWSSCSTTCDPGIRMRIRGCGSPPPSHGGAYCDGQSTLAEVCMEEECGRDVCKLTLKAQSTDTFLYKPWRLKVYFHLKPS